MPTTAIGTPGPTTASARREDGGPEIGEGATGVAQAVEGEEVAGRDPAGSISKRWRSALAAAPAAGLGGGDHRLFDELARFRRGECGRVVEEDDEVGVAGEDLAQAPARPEQQAEPARRARATPGRP